ncbi:hypothetical protein POSPLADRAFT_1185430 [Postia placenta MAD-698-R-SB12]|uniref:DUF7704 domain-containing protein n=1 Tax=Postia placenta MAD-698-R-SB12 TaxID=670580 RepID=A0A1X6MP73_9APHY|nr:hypothetical protein POSPLADRAFT_1185430 [Postia placenta MAD-698-R-SB12]OSX57992.1 hypothetical protein POSPLADRAFT_1185430 [Postia placenta MAD-698-R-SB12]
MGGTSVTNAIPGFYYFAFGIFEPVLALAIFIGIVADPLKIHNQQGPWRVDPPAELSTATRISVLQLSYLSAVVGLTNIFVIHAARKHLASNLPLQETIIKALLWPLLFGDVAHFSLTTYALIGDGWDIAEWPSLVWVGCGIGLYLFVARVAWFAGVGRYVEKRDGKHKRA